MTVTAHDKLNALLGAGRVTETGVYVILTETCYRYDGIKFSNIWESNVSSLYQNMVAPSLARTGAKHLKQLKAKTFMLLIIMVLNFKTQTAKNNRKYQILTIDRKDDAYGLYKVTKCSESKLYRITAHHLKPCKKSKGYINI